MNRGQLNGMFGSETPIWETPQDLFDELDRHFHFSLDVCALEKNAKCAAYFTPEQDGLSQNWTGRCWMNPPFGRDDTAKWLRKAYESSLAGATVVCLLPVRSDTWWWHDYVGKSTHVEFVRGRLKFGGSKSSAPFPSAIVVFAADDFKMPPVGGGILTGQSLLRRQFEGRGLVMKPVRFKSRGIKEKLSTRAMHKSMI